MATYQAVILIPDAATFVADSEIGFINLASGYETYYVAQNAANANELLTAIGLYFTDVFAFGGTWSFTNVGETYTITYITTSEIDWTNTPSFGNFFAFKSDTSSEFYANFATLSLVETPTILTDSCTDCFEIDANECNQIGLNLGLVEGEDYTINITDKFGKMYSLTATADEDGIIYIDNVDLPDYLLNPYAGSFIVQVYLNDSLQQFVINNHLFGCFTLNIIAGTGLSNLVPNIQATLASDLDIEVLGNE